VDSPGRPAEELIGLTQTLLWVRLERAKSPADVFLKSLKNPVYEVLVEGASHGSVLDWEYLTANTEEKRDSGGRHLRIIEDYVAAFLDTYLKGKNSELLDSANRKAPGARLTIHRPRADKAD
jgi:hypothetical protein